MYGCRITEHEDIKSEISKLLSEICKLKARKTKNTLKRQRKNKKRIQISEVCRLKSAKLAIQEANKHAAQLAPKACLLAKLPSKSRSCFASSYMWSSARCMSYCMLHACMHGMHMEHDGMHDACHGALHAACMPCTWSLIEGLHDACHVACRMHAMHNLA